MNATTGTSPGAVDLAVSAAASGRSAPVSAAAAADAAWAAAPSASARCWPTATCALIVLALLEEGPRHGYEIIKALEEKSSGVYSPSPGVVYPTLTYLEEVGYATATSEGTKKVYSITDTGRAHLAENREVADMVLDGIEKFGRKMSQARDWWEGQRRGGERGAPTATSPASSTRSTRPAAS